MNDANLTVVLTTENANAFEELFAANNVNGFRTIESEVTESYDNPNGLSFRAINFQPNYDLSDIAYNGIPEEHSLKKICERFGVKRLIVYCNNPDAEYEESITYDKAKGIVYQGRDNFPAPDSMYLDEDETISDCEAEAE